MLTKKGSLQSGKPNAESGKPASEQDRFIARRRKGAQRGTIYERAELASDIGRDSVVVPSSPLRTPSFRGWKSKRGTRNSEWGVRNREPGTGNGEWGMGNGEYESPDSQRGQSAIRNPTSKIQNPKSKIKSIATKSIAKSAAHA